MYDFNLVKTDANGNMIWAKQYGGTGRDEIRCLIHVSDGGYIACGSTNSFTGSSDGYVVKIDSAGNLLWSKTYGGSNTENLNSVIETPDSGFIFAGLTNSYISPIATRTYVVRTNNSGDTLWTRIYNIVSTSNSVVDIKPTADGGFIAAGQTGGLTIGAFLLKADSNGMAQWSRIFPVSASSFFIKAVALTFDGGYVMAGWMSGSPGDDICVFKTDSAGNLLWKKRCTSAVYPTDRAWDVLSTADGKIIIAAGSFGATTFADIVCMDSTGNLLWTKYYGLPGSYTFGTAILQTDNGGYALAGTRANSTVSGFYLTTTDSAGTTLCEQQPASMTTSDLAFSSTVIPSISHGSGGDVTTAATISLSSGSENSMCVSTEVTETTTEDFIFSLSPNPVTNQLTISSGLRVVEEIEIYDVLGKRHRMTTLTKDAAGTVDVSSLVPGIYVIKIRGEKEEYVAKFIKQ